MSEAELIGLGCARDRVEANAAARKPAAIAQLDRRNPAPGDAEFTADQLAYALGESRARAEELMGTAGHLDTHLPGTRAALRDGTELRQAGLDGGLDELRARAYLDLLLNKDSRPRPSGATVLVGWRPSEVAWLLDYEMPCPLDGIAEC